MNTVSLRNPESIEDLGCSHFEQRFLRSRTVVSRRVAGETLIVPIRGKVGDLASIYSFNATGSLIWEALESPRSLAELVAAVEQEYAVEHEQAECDVKQFLNESVNVGLVEVCEQVSVAAIGSVTRELHAIGGG